MASGLSGKWRGGCRMELYDLLAQVVQTVNGWIAWGCVTFGT